MLSTCNLDSASNQQLRLVTCALFLVFLVPFSAEACPTWENAYGTSLNTSAYEFDKGVSSWVVAGGGENLSNCRRVPGVGYVASYADFTADIVPSVDEAIVFEASGNCDVVLLVNTANRNWFFDDDDGVPHGDDARIVLTRPSAGRYDIWIGTFGTEFCDAVLSVWTAPLNSTRNASLSR